MQILRPQLVTVPTVDPVTIEQAKKQCEIAESDTAHDDHFYRLIESARQELETDCDMAIALQTWKVFASSVYDGMQLYKGPIQSITSIKYYDAGNAQQTLPTSIYDFDVANRTIRLKYNQIWPSTVNRFDAWEITYLCGFANPPGIAVQAMLILIEKYFLGREALKEPQFRTYERLVMKLQRSTYP